MLAERWQGPLSLGVTVWDRTRVQNRQPSEEAPPRTGLGKAVVSPGTTVSVHPEWLKEMSILRLEPGDVLVLSCDQAISHETAVAIKEAARREFGDIRVMVLSNGLRLGVLRRGVGEVEP